MVCATLAAAAEAVARSTRTPVAKKAVVDLTAAAATRIRELLSQRHKVRRVAESDSDGVQAE